MARSPHFARIKSDVLQIIRAVPQGRLVTFRMVGTHLDVVARHVAYILATLDVDEQASTHWYRAIPEDGTLRTQKANQFGISQRDLLREEGHAIAKNGSIANWQDKLFEITEAGTGVARQQRPTKHSAPSSHKRGRE